MCCCQTESDMTAQAHKQYKNRAIRSVPSQNIKKIILVRRLLLIEFVLNRFCPKWCAILVGTKKCWHCQRPRDRIQFGEAAVPVEQVELVLLCRRVRSVLWVVVPNCLYPLRKKNFVVVSATPSGTQDPREALESVSENEPHTFRDIVRHCVALSFVKLFFARSQSLCLDKQKVSCWKNCLVVRGVHVRTRKLTLSGRLRVCE